MTTTTASLARFKIGDKTYTTSAIDEISLRDLLLFESQAADIGLTVKWADVERKAMEMGELDPKAAEQHPDALLVTAVTIWASRRIAGDQVTFGEAIDIKIKDLVFLPPTEDHRPNPTKPRKGSTKKKSPARASAAPVEPDAPSADPEAKKTSASPSDDA